MSSNRRKFVRRPFGNDAKIVASDGSWDSDCRVIDISDGGAKLGIDKPANLPGDFVLAPSQHGKVTRRCHIVWSEGDEIGVEFERPKKRVPFR